MQRVFSTYKIWRSVASYARNDHCARSFSTLSIGRLHQSEFLYDFMKWGSIGFRRMSRFATGFNPLREKPLDSIVDIHRLKDRYPDDIASIWDDYHIGRGHIGATMKAKLYHLLDHRAKECRYFVIPLWRGSGYTTMFVQATVKTKPYSSIVILTLHYQCKNVIIRYRLSTPFVWGTNVMHVPQQISGCQRNSASP